MLSVRPGLMSKYGWKTEDEARKQVKVYGAYEELLADKNIEAVVIALPFAPACRGSYQGHAGRQACADGKAHGAFDSWSAKRWVGRLVRQESF